MLAPYPQVADSSSRVGIKLIQCIYESNLAQEQAAVAAFMEVSNACVFHTRSSGDIYCYKSLEGVHDAALVVYTGNLQWPAKNKPSITH